MRREFTRFRLLALIVGGALVASCGEGLTPPEQTLRRYGSIVIEGNATSATTVTAISRGIFFRSSTAAVPSSITSQNDQCTTTQVDTTTVELLGVEKAGDALSLQVSSETVPMNYIPVGFRYDSPSFNYTVGTSAQLSVPGNGEVFPAGSVSVLLAEPIIAPPVTVSTTQPMTIIWNASTSSTSAVILSLRYANPGNVGYGNFQLVCQMKDDGNNVIPLSRLTDFLNSPPVHRSLTLTRFRTNETNIDDRSLLHINSQITIPVVLQ